MHGIRSPAPTSTPSYEKTMSLFNTPYLYIIWTKNKLVGGDGSASLLNFAEIQRFGREVLPNSTEYEFPTKPYNSFTPETPNIY